MTTRYTTDRQNGEIICSICGAPTPKREPCCPCAPYVSFNDFKKLYFGTADVPYHIVVEFHDDYLHSNCRSLTEYISQTSA